MKNKYESPEFDLHRFRFDDIMSIDISNPENSAEAGYDGPGEDPFAQQ